MQTFYVHGITSLLRFILHELCTCLTCLVQTGSQIGLQVPAGEALIYVWAAVPLLLCNGQEIFLISCLMPIQDK